MSALPESPPALRLPQTLDGWVRYFSLVEIPVLPATAQALEEMRANEDEVDARLITEVVGVDPLMTLKLLAFTANHFRERRHTDAETVREALVLLGITPFFRIFGPQPTINQHLSDQPEALDGLKAVLHRADRAARFAIGFAVHRADHDAPVIHEAALLHDFAEMLLWLHAPALALEMTRRLQADPTLRSAAVQRQLLGTTLGEIQQQLMRQWRLPALLVQITDDRHDEATQVRNVLLAVRLARHTAHGWHNAAVPDDVADIARLLNMSAEPTLALLHEIDDDT